MLKVKDIASGITVIYKHLTLDDLITMCKLGHMEHVETLYDSLGIKHNIFRHIIDSNTHIYDIVKE